jgi:putative ABC transport system ATP-binding protein
MTPKEPQTTDLSSSALLNLNGTRLAYPTPDGEIEVLCGIDLIVNEGEIVAVTGPSGSGKSSLIAVVGGLEIPTGGASEVLGVEMMQATERERTHLRRKDIGVVFQAYHLVPAMTALQNVALPLLLMGATDSEIRAAQILQSVGLGHRLNHRPNALSGGEQQRVAIARAFVATPRLVLADEPTGNLDQTTGSLVAETMFSLTRDSGAAMLLVTHDEKLAHRCDRVIAIDAGRVTS